MKTHPKLILSYFQQIMDSSDEDVADIDHDDDVDDADYGKN